MISITVGMISPRRIFSREALCRGNKFQAAFFLDRQLSGRLFSGNSFPEAFFLGSLLVYSKSNVQLSVNSVKNGNDACLLELCSLPIKCLSLLQNTLFLLLWQTKLIIWSRIRALPLYYNVAYKKQEICCTVQNEPSLPKCRPVFVLGTKILFSIEKCHMDKCYNDQGRQIIFLARVSINISYALLPNICLSFIRS